MVLAAAFPGSRWQCSCEACAFCQGSRLRTIPSGLLNDARIGMIMAIGNQLNQAKDDQSDQNYDANYFPDFYGSLQAVTKFLPKINY